MWRGLAVGAVCVVVAAITPAASGADHRDWITTAVPRATLVIAGKGPRVSALSADGRVAVVADPRGAYLFRVSSAGSWKSISRPAARLKVPSPSLGNLSAAALSSDGTTVLVGAGAAGKSRAAAYVFHASSPRAWTGVVSPAATLTSAAEPAGFGSGVALSSDGTTALIGEPAGAAVFHVTTADSWRDTSTPAATLVAGAPLTEVGGVSTAVALSAAGTTALIGMTSDYTFVGAAYIFRASAADGWASSATPDAVLTDGAVGRLGDGFGAAAALSPDGRTALIGAPDPVFGPSGAAYLFRVRKADAWSTTADPDAILERGSGDVPGWSVALSGEGTALVGEPSLFGRHGAADVFHVAEPVRSWRPTTVSETTLTDAASLPRDLFGAAVAISADGTTALVSSVRSSVLFTRSAAQDSSHCYVPYVGGEPVGAAKRAIEATRCRVGKVSRADSSQVPGDRVISQSPNPGERLARRARVDLRVSTGRNG